jgi:uncharacterized protein (TIGR02598 family)
MHISPRNARAAGGYNRQNLLMDEARIMTVKRRQGGFSLVEVVLALGIVAFAFVALFGLLPIGLNTFTNSTDSTIESQIAESVTNQVKQEKFSQLYAEFNDTNAKPANTAPYSPPAPGFYFDEQGRPIISGTSGVGGQGGVTGVVLVKAPSQYVYSAGVQVYYNGNLPVNAQPSGTLANNSVTNFSQVPMATIVVTVSKVSTPNNARIYTSYVNNNGL